MTRVTRNRWLGCALAMGVVMTANCKQKPPAPAAHADHAGSTPASPTPPPSPARTPATHDHSGAPEPSPTANPVLPPGYAPVEVDQGRQQLLGIKTMAVRRLPIDKAIRTVGIVQSDETRTSHVHVKFDGFIEQIYVNYTGRQVKRGQPLLKIFSRDLLAAQQEYLASRQALTSASAPGAEAAQRAAGQLVAASRERLQLFDMPESVLKRIERTGVAERAITLLSPQTGTVIEKQALEGLAVTPRVHLYVIADLSRVWVQADVYERDLAQVKVGQKAELRLEAMPGRSFEGTVTFLSPVVDQSTRTVKVRFEFPNRDGALRPGMYATVQIAAGEGEGLVIPADSLIDTGERKVVFVTRGQGRFEPRAVVTGAAFAGQYEVLEGLAEGEVIAASGQFLLDSESRIRGARTGGAAPAHGGH
jgi:membrane fusion protein, copper/silver efflux system